ncbi:MAG: YdaS family helix-turn-helix protein [Hydrogenophaga sp.]|nr:YdaS family helix-turn-helix protein [Hydrogenophaga sp.]
MSKLFLEKLVQIIGGQVALANRLSIDGRQIKQAHVWGWLNKTADGIPSAHVIGACSATDWQVTPHQLRPDIYPHPHDGLPDHLRGCVGKSLKTEFYNSQLNISGSTVLPAHGPECGANQASLST